MRFVCDVMLGKLAKYLRILGFDAVYLRSGDLLEQYAREDDPPLFLTRRGKGVTYKKTTYITSENVWEQVREIKELIKPFINSERILGRCINCNRLLADVEKESIEHRVPEFVFHTYNAFKICPQCQRVYWAGTHTEKMAQLIAEVTS